MATLKNIVYTGKIVFKGEIIDGMHEAIIDPEVFESVQKLQRQRAKRNEKKFKIYKNLVFGGLVKCRECGMTMTKTFCNKHTTDGLKRYFYYRCSQLGYVSKCSTSQVSAERLRKEILTNLERIADDEIYLENTTAQIVRGDTIELGPGCEIELAEYKNSFKVNKDSAVAEHKKV